MLLIRKSSVAVMGIVLLAPAVFAQNKTALLKYLSPKQEVRKTLQNITRVPSKYASVTELGGVRRMNFQNAVLDGLAMGIERQALAVAQAQHQAPASAPKQPHVNTWCQTAFSHEELQAKAQKATEFIKDYLAANGNVWPVYEPHSQGAGLLKRISNFMEVEKPSAQVLYIQQEIIRLRAASRARSPQEVLTIVQDMIRYGMIPSRAYVSEENRHTVEELQVGEDLAFAIAAYKVPMKDNPWNMLEMQEVADKTAVYNAMRRTDPLFEGLPETFVKDGIHQPNFPVWTRSEFTWRQQKWVHEHPFEYALATYWEKVFGQSLYRIYNHLSEINKQAILFAAPGLPQVADTMAENFAQYYDKALQNWIATHHKAPQSRVDSEREEYFGAVLAHTQPYQHALKFRDSENHYGDFADLASPEQLEVLLWVWQKYQIIPQEVLRLLGTNVQPYF